MGFPRPERQGHRVAEDLSADLRAALRESDKGEALHRVPEAGVSSRGPDGAPGRWGPASPSQSRTQASPAPRSPPAHPVETQLIPDCAPLVSLPPPPRPHTLGLQNTPALFCKSGD